VAAEGEKHSITIVAERHLPELLPLLRAYCDFYRVAPTDEDLLALSQALIADPRGEGVQLIAHDLTDHDRPAVGFATVFWSWSTTKATRVGVMHDLFVAEPARGSGLAERLIAACVERCATRGAGALTWETALDNVRAQKVYDRVGGRRSRWLSYQLAVPSP
jgi:GNAT superfamily N-acetyltransferase